MTLSSRSRALTVFAALALSAGCTRIDNTLARVPVFAFLRSAPSFDPYENTRPAPVGSVPFSAPNGNAEAPLANSEQALNAFAATPAARNPFAPGDTAALRHGAAMFERYCMVCHGPAGKGDGPILNKPGETGKFPFAPNLTIAPTTTRPDGYIYGIIRVGRGLMPPYGDKIPERDRWTIVSYVRQLQGAQAQPAPAAPGQAQAAPQTPQR